MTLRSKLIRLAHSLPQGSDERRAVLKLALSGAARRALTRDHDFQRTAEGYERQGASSVLVLRPDFTWTVLTGPEHQPWK